MPDDRHCSLCGENLPVKFGTLVCVVPLFRPTKNKAYLSGSRESVILADLCKEIGIRFHPGAAQDQVEKAVLCKKCARKIYSCYTQYKDIEEGFSKTVSGITDSPP